MSYNTISKFALLLVMALAGSSASVADAHSLPQWAVRVQPAAARAVGPRLPNWKPLRCTSAQCKSNSELVLRGGPDDVEFIDAILLGMAREFVHKIAYRDHCDICDQCIPERSDDGSVNFRYTCDCEDCDFTVCQDCYTSYELLALDPQNLEFIRETYRKEMFQLFTPEKIVDDKVVTGTGYEKMRRTTYKTTGSLQWYINDNIRKYYPLVSTLSTGLEKLRGKRHFGLWGRWVENSQLLHIIERRFAFFWHTLNGSTGSDRSAAVEECECVLDQVSDDHFWVRRPLMVPTGRDGDARDRWEPIKSFAAVPQLTLEENLKQLERITKRQLENLTFEDSLKELQKVKLQLQLLNARNK